MMFGTIFMMSRAMVLSCAWMVFKLMMANNTPCCRSSCVVVIYLNPIEMLRYPPSLCVRDRVCVCVCMYLCVCVTVCVCLCAHDRVCA